MRLETRRQKIQRLELELAKALEERDIYHRLLISQGAALSDVGDILEELGLRNFWHKHLDGLLGGPGLWPQGEAIFKKAKAQSGEPNVDFTTFERDPGWLEEQAEKEEADRLEQERLEKEWEMAEAAAQVRLQHREMSHEA